MCSPSRQVAPGELMRTFCDRAAFGCPGTLRPKFHMITCNDSAGGSKGPARPLGGVRGKEAWEAYVPAFLPHPTAGGGARAKKPEELRSHSLCAVCDTLPL